MKILALAVTALLPCCLMAEETLVQKFEREMAEYEAARNRSSSSSTRSSSEPEPEEKRNSLSYISHPDGTTSSVYSYSSGLIMVVSPRGDTKSYINAGNGQIMECQ